MKILKVEQNSAKNPFLKISILEIQFKIFFHFFLKKKVLVKVYANTNLL